MKRLAVIIPTFNRKKFITNLISQIEGISHANFRLSIIVVVDGSTDGTSEIISQKFPDIHIVKGTGDWWYTKSINEGLVAAEKLEAEYVLTLNDDILLKEDFFESLERCLQIAPKNSIIGALSLTKSNPERILSAGVKDIIRWRYKLVSYIPMFTVREEVRELRGLKPVEVLPGRGMFFSVNISKKTNGFDSKFLQYHSDYDFCLRAKKKGFSLFVSWDLIVYSFIEETGEGTSYLKTSFKTFIKGFFRKQSRTNLIDNARFLYRHGIKPLFPLTYLIFVLSCFNSHFFKKKING